MLVFLESGGKQLNQNLTRFELGILQLLVTVKLIVSKSLKEEMSCGDSVNELKPHNS